jgi:hypothetical protein
LLAVIEESFDEGRGGTATAPLPTDVPFFFLPFFFFPIMFWARTHAAR